MGIPGIVLGIIKSAASVKSASTIGRSLGVAKKVIREVDTLSRYNKARVSFGPARGYYGKGLAGKIPYHVELNWSKKFFIVEKHVRRNTSRYIKEKRW